MKIQRFTSTDNKFKDKLIQILIELDASSKTNEKTSKMARNLFGCNNKEYTDKQILTHFYENVTDEVIVATLDNEPIGFNCVKENVSYFNGLSDEYFPHIAVTYSVVPSAQREGVWRNLRTFVEKDVCSEYDVDYLISPVTKNNTSSIKANESVGMRNVQQIEYGGDQKYLYVKEVNLGLF